jgi:isopentenyl diphosphate isomerase/L-lactate dehydrogenase-like FMN-dependent dehydrogenase
MCSAAPPGAWTCYAQSGGRSVRAPPAGPGALLCSAAAALAGGAPAAPPRCDAPPHCDAPPRCDAPGNIVGHAKAVSNAASLSAWTAEQFDPTLSWDDVAWVKERWGGPLVIKGLMDPHDAVRAADAGADAIVVSNHGGRQLDGAPSSLGALPAVLRALADRPRGRRVEVWMDGAPSPKTIRK